MAGASARSAADRAPPPISIARRIGTPCARSASSPSASPHSRPSTVARASRAGVALARVSPVSRPRASGRSGVRSPSRNGSSTSPPLSGVDSASSSSRARSTPSRVAVAPSTRAALSVQTSGRNRPVASAKPATSPLASAVGVSRDRGDHPAGADRHGHVAGDRAEAERGGHVVAGARAEHARRPRCARPASAGAGHRRQRDLPAERQPQQVRPVVACGR